MGQHPAIPRSDADLSPDDHIQAIANTAGFHFAFIEQGGTSLYPALAVFRQNTNCYGRDAADTDTLCSIFGSKATLITGLMEGRNDEVAGLPAEQESGA